MTDKIRPWHKLRATSATEQAAAVVDRELQKEVVRINGSSMVISPLPANDLLLSKDEPETKRMSTNHSGLTGLSAKIARLKTAQDQVLTAGEALDGAINEITLAADEYTRLGRKLEREAAEAMSAIGQISNGAPE